MRANYHSHCDYCDGSSSARAMAEAACAAGFGVLGISSHAPLGRGLYEGNMKLPRLGGYLAEIRSLAREWEGRGLEILLGLEIDWLREAQSPRDALFAGLGLDYSIGSVHLVDLGSGPFAVDESAESFRARVEADAGGDARRVWKAYYEELCALIEAGGFDILGHLDLVTKYNRGGELFDESDPAYREAALGAAALLGGADIVIEINYGAMLRSGAAAPYPAPFILRALRERGVRVVLSADAHAPEQLGPAGSGAREAAREAARAAGYRSVALLSKGSWTEVGIDEA
ncbi:MAG TPA: histidinol-phosphatase [Spirochaetia bacterium]|nr:histidinol-phosphatase [Spirochaetia bacterium]HRZ66095.1 histidinol-phosphatase [Spirochaetia bacterium]